MQLPTPPNYNATMSMYSNGRPSVISSRILESSVDSTSQLPPPMELPPESSSFRSPPNYAQAAHRRITGNSTVISSYPAPHQNFGSSSRIIAAVGISPITPTYVPAGVNSISPMYTGNVGTGNGNSTVPGANSNLPPAIPARLHESSGVVPLTLESVQPPPPLPPSIDLSIESSSVTVISNAAPVL